MPGPPLVWTGEAVVAIADEGTRITKALQKYCESEGSSGRQQRTQVVGYLATPARAVGLCAVLMKAAPRQLRGKS